MRVPAGTDPKRLFELAAAMSPDWLTTEDGSLVRTSAVIEVAVENDSSREDDERGHVYARGILDQLNREFDDILDGRTPPVRGSRTSP